MKKSTAITLALVTYLTSCDKPEQGKYVQKNDTTWATPEQVAHGSLPWIMIYPHYYWVPVATHIPVEVSESEFHSSSSSTVRGGFGSSAQR